MVIRGTTAAVQVRDVSIPAGEQVALLLGSANRDPDEFDDPDRLTCLVKAANTSRSVAGHTSASAAALGRLEGQLAIENIVRRLPNLQLAGDQVRWRPFPAFRGLFALPVTF